MKRLFIYTLFAFLICVAHAQTRKNNSLIDSLKKSHKIYDNNGVKQSRKNKHQQKTKKPIKASSMMDTLGDKPNSHENDK